MNNVKIKYVQKDFKEEKFIVTISTVGESRCIEITTYPDMLFNDEFIESFVDKILEKVLRVSISEKETLFSMDEPWIDGNETAYIVIPKNETKEDEELLEEIEDIVFSQKK